MQSLQFSGEDSSGWGPSWLFIRGSHLLIVGMNCIPKYLHYWVEIGQEKSKIVAIFNPFPPCQTSLGVGSKRERACSAWCYGLYCTTVREPTALPRRNRLSKIGPLIKNENICTVQSEFYKKLKNVSCEYDGLNGWNSTLQAAWDIRHVRWTCLLYTWYLVRSTLFHL